MGGPGAEEEGYLKEMFLEVEKYHYEIDKDIIIIELAKKVDLTIFTPVCISKQDDKNNFKKAWVYGEFGLSLA